MKKLATSLVAFSWALTVCSCLVSAQDFEDSPALPAFVSPQPLATYTVAVGDGVVVEVPIISHWAGGSGNGLHLLNDPSVMKDLELVDDQRERLANVQKEFGQQFNDAMQQFGKSKNDQARIKEIQEEMQAIQKEKAEALANVLLPHQLDRIKQVSNQMQINAQGTAGALQYGFLAKELEISDEQKKKLAEIQKKLQEDIAEKTKQLQEAAKKQVLQELTAEQRAKLKDMTGEEFKRDPKDWQERFNSIPQPAESSRGSENEIKIGKDRHAQRDLRQLGQDGLPTATRVGFGGTLELAMDLRHIAFGTRVADTVVG